MNNKFFTTTASNEVNDIKSELLNKGFIEAEPCGDANVLFIDTTNKLFWHCDNENLEQNTKLSVQLEGKEPQHITLNEIKSWAN